MLVKFLIGLYAMYDPIRKLNKVNLVVQQSMAAAQRIRSLMTLPVEIQDRPGAVVAPELEREIHFENVSFRYEEKEVLSGVELTVRRGEAVALVGPVRGRQDDALQPGAAVLRRHRRANPHRRRGRARHPAREPARHDRPGDPGDGAVQRDGARQHRLRPQGPAAREGARSGARRLCRRVHPRAARGLRDDRRRGRRASIGRAAATARDRPRAAQERADPDPRRGDLDARHRVRVAGAEGARQPDARPHDLRHRSPFDDHHHGGPDLRHRSRANRRAGEPCGAARRATDSTDASTISSSGSDVGGRALRAKPSPPRTTGGSARRASRSPA